MMKRNVINSAFVLLFALALLIVPTMAADADGIGVFRDSNGVWYFGDGVTADTVDSTWKFGKAGDQAFASEDEIGVFRGSNGVWYFGDGVTADAVDSTWKFGKAGDQAFASDDTIGVFRGSNGVWYFGDGVTADAVDSTWKFGKAGDIPFVSGDVIGVFRPSNGVWYFGDGVTADAVDSTWKFGKAGDIPFVSGDDIGVFRPSNGVWYFGDGVTADAVDSTWKFGKAGDSPFIYGSAEPAPLEVVSVEAITATTVNVTFAAPATAEQAGLKVWEVFGVDVYGFETFAVALVEADDAWGEAELSDALIGSGTYVLVQEGFDDVEFVWVEPVHTYDVTFTVVDEEDAAIEDATVILGEWEATTDEDGVALFEDVEAAEYVFIVSADGYVPFDGTVEVVDEDVFVDITLVAVVPTYDVTFTVVDEEDAAIEGALVALNGAEEYTNEDGVAIFSVEAGEYDYTVSKLTYDDATGNVEVIDEDVEVPVTLTAIERVIDSFGIASGEEEIVNLANQKANFVAFDQFDDPIEITAAGMTGVTVLAYKNNVPLLGSQYTYVRGDDFVTLTTARTPGESIEIRFSSAEISTQSLYYSIVEAGDPVPAEFVLTASEDEIYVDESVDFTVEVKDQYGFVYPVGAEGILWTINDVGIEYAGIDWTHTFGAADYYFVEAFLVEDTDFSDIVLVTVTARPEPAVTTVEVAGEEIVTIPATGTNTETYTATVYDQFEAPMPDEEVTWSLADEIGGVSIDETTGVVTVTYEAETGTFIVVATSVTDDAVYGDFEVELILDDAEVTTVVVAGEDTINIPTTDETTAEYTATVYDQYDREMPDEDVTWSLTATPTGVAIDAETGVVTVNYLTEEGTITVVATSVTDPTVSDEFEVTLEIAALDVTSYIGVNSTSFEFVFNRIINVDEVDALELLDDEEAAIAADFARDATDTTLVRMTTGPALTQDDTYYLNLTDGETANFPYEFDYEGADFSIALDDTPASKDIATGDADVEVLQFIVSNDGSTSAVTLTEIDFALTTGSDARAGNEITRVTVEYTIDGEEETVSKNIPVAGNFKNVDLNPDVTLRPGETQVFTVLVNTSVDADPLREFGLKVDGFEHDSAKEPTGTAVGNMMRIMLPGNSKLEVSKPVQPAARTIQSNEVDKEELQVFKFDVAAVNKEVKLRDVYFRNLGNALFGQNDNQSAYNLSYLNETGHWVVINHNVGTGVAPGTGYTNDYIRISGFESTIPRHETVQFAVSVIPGLNVESGTKVELDMPNIQGPTVNNSLFRSDADDGVFLLERIRGNVFTLEQVKGAEVFRNQTTPAATEFFSCDGKQPVLNFTIESLGGDLTFNTVNFTFATDYTGWWNDNKAVLNITNSTDIEVGTGILLDNTTAGKLKEAQFTFDTPAFKNETFTVWINTSAMTSVYNADLIVKIADADKLNLTSVAGSRVIPGGANCQPFSAIASEQMTFIDRAVSEFDAVKADAASYPRNATYEIFRFTIGATRDAINLTNANMTLSMTGHQNMPNVVNLTVMNATGTELINRELTNNNTAAGEFILRFKADADNNLIPKGGEREFIVYANNTGTANFTKPDVYTFTIKNELNNDKSIKSLFINGTTKAVSGAFSENKTVNKVIIGQDDIRMRFNDIFVDDAAYTFTTNAFTVRDEYKLDASLAAVQPTPTDFADDHSGIIKATKLNLKNNANVNLNVTELNVTYQNSTADLIDFLFILDEDETVLNTSTQIDSASPGFKPMTLANGFVITPGTTRSLYLAANLTDTNNPGANFNLSIWNFDNITLNAINGGDVNVTLATTPLRGQDINIVSTLKDVGITTTPYSGQENQWMNFTFNASGTLAAGGDVTIDLGQLKTAGVDFTSAVLPTTGPWGDTKTDNLTVAWVDDRNKIKATVKTGKTIDTLDTTLINVSGVKIARGSTAEDIDLTFKRSDTTADLVIEKVDIKSSLVDLQVTAVFNATTEETQTIQFTLDGLMTSDYRVTLQPQNDTAMNNDWNGATVSVNYGAIAKFGTGNYRWTPTFPSTADGTVVTLTITKLPTTTWDIGIGNVTYTRTDSLFTKLKDFEIKDGR